MNQATATARILLVEDSELDAELVLDEIAREGLAAVAERVDDEDAFVAALQHFAPDLVVSDLSMPGFSGYRALEIARALAPRLPFVFVSGTMGEEAAVEALRGGATDYVLKHNLGRLGPAVRRALAEASERQAREQAEQDLLRAQRYESLAVLASGLSHDLRNVLQPISMGVGLLREDPREEVRRVGELISDCTQRGLEIVASMLSFARGSRAAIERVNVRLLLEGLQLLLRANLAEGVRLQVQLPEDGLELDGNHTELQQCLLNLCLNAIQAMPEGGDLQVSVDRLELSAGDFGPGETGSPGPYLRMTVRDTGIGMSPEVRARLFQPFFTTRASGTGLGLVSCRRILENHRSFMRIDSEVGRGTTFRLYFPLPPARPEVRTPDEIARGHGARVLVVIEAAGKLSLLTDVIGSHGYRVTPAQNGAVALQSLDREGLPDAVVMEARMNLMTGVRTAAALVERDFSGPVLLIAHPGDAAIGEDIPPLRRVRFIDKPVDPLQLLSVLADETATLEAGA